MRRAILKKRKQMYKLYNALNWQQKEAINIMALAEFDLLPKQKRSNPRTLIKRAIELYLVKDYYKNLEEFININKLDNEAKQKVWSWRCALTCY